MTLRIPALVMVAFAVPQIAPAQSVYVPPNSYQRPEPRPISLLNRHYLDRMTAIREDALALRASDGGTLAEEHRAMIQARIDKVEARYRRELRRSNPMSVGADGAPAG